MCVGGGADLKSSTGGDNGGGGEAAAKVLLFVKSVFVRLRCFCSFKVLLFV